MKYRVAAISIAAWTFVGGPALCTADVIGHPCACSDGCGEDDSTPCPIGHRCEEDPCQVHVIRPSDGAADLDACRPHAPVLGAATLPDGSTSGLIHEGIRTHAPLCLRSVPVLSPTATVVLLL